MPRFIAIFHLDEKALFCAPSLCDKLHYGQLPPGWAWCRLGELSIKIGSGSTPRGGKSVYQNSGIKFIRSQNVYDDGLYLGDIAYISDKMNKKMIGTTIQPYDILLNITGASLGRCAIVPHDFDGGNVNQHVSIIRLVDTNLHAYIHKALISDHLQEMIMNIQVGAAQEGLPAEKQKSLFIPLPPLAEQYRITAAINSTFAVIGEIERNKTDLQTAVTAAKSKIISLAIRGKLVPQDPKDEPAYVLLERIRSEQEKLIKAGKIKRAKGESTIFRGDDNSYYEQLPSGWVLVKISDTFWINPRNIAEDSVKATFVPMSLINEGFSNSFTFQERKWNEIKSGFTHFQEGDIGLAKITPCLENRKSVVFRGLIGGIGAGTTELHIFRPICANTVVPEYLLWFIKSEWFINRCINAFSGAVGQQRVRKNFVAETLMPLPPLTEQYRIVAAIESALKQLTIVIENLS